MANLLINRYQQTCPTSIQENGCSISCPMYIALTTEQNKQLLNAFREVQRKQLLEAGHSTTTQKGSMTIETAQHTPKTPAELELGMDENNLRYALFNRQGINERLLLKLQKITGMEIITREQLTDVAMSWINHLFTPDTNGTKTTKTPSKRSTRTKAQKPVSKPSTELECKAD